MTGTEWGVVIGAVAAAVTPLLIAAGAAFRWVYTQGIARCDEDRDEMRTTITAKNKAIRALETRNDELREDLAECRGRTR